jgi:hypothetical protein
MATTVCLDRVAPSPHGKANRDYSWSAVPLVGHSFGNASPVFWMASAPLPPSA